LDTASAHRFQNIPRRHRILLQILARILRTEAHVRIGGQVEDTFGSRHTPDERIEVQHVATFQGELRMAQRAVKELDSTRREVVEADYAVALAQQSIHQVASNEPGCARDECNHGFSKLPVFVLRANWPPRDDSLGAGEVATKKRML
jgi:hypothetical protein